jgi:hypothetical protein
MIRALMVVLLASPAWADVPPPVGAAITICRTNGPDLAGRVTALQQTGWQVIAPGDRAGIVAAMAPYELVRVGQPEPDDSLFDRADLLARATDHLMRWAARDNAAEVWLAAPDAQAYLHLLSRIPTIVECRIAAPIGSADYAAMLGAQATAFSYGIATVTELSVDGTRPTALSHILFPDGSFGSLPILPILTTPPSAVTP